MIAWFRKWGWLIGLIALGVAIMILTLGKKKVDVGAAVAMAEAQARAKKLEAQIGRDAAKKKIEEDYAETIEKLDENEKKQAAELADDPGARARFYARVARKVSGPKVG